jgi:hypothetical protein
MDSTKQLGVVGSGTRNPLLFPSLKDAISVAMEQWTWFNGRGPSHVSRKGHFTVRRHSVASKIPGFKHSPGGYKYGNLALQVGGVSNETVKYGREFCGTSTQE